MPGFFQSVAALGARGPLLAAWVIDGPRIGARALFALVDGRWAEACRDEAFPADAAAAIRGAPPGQTGVMSSGGGRLFLEPIARGRKLVICGAGHVSMPVIRLGRMLGFEVTAIDDREAFAARAAEAGAQRALCRPFPEALDAVEGDPSAAFVIMTREHAHDVECLRRVLKKPRAYVGMMGSRSRSENVRRQLLAEGFDAEAVAAARMPIGLPIGSRTPEEIAVSVMAEIISVMNASDAGEAFPPGMLEALAALEGEAASPAVLAVIVEKVGEAPRRPGTKMLVTPDGRFIGTVGGGAAEAMILKAANDLLREGRREARLVRAQLEKGTMRCGGEIAALLLPMF